MSRKIILLGYMGSGKSTVGEELARKLQVSFIDLDNEIEILEKKSISEIFDSKGAIYFRKLEKIVLENTINRKDSFVLSLGGGTPCYFDTMNYLNNQEGVQTIYLDVAISTLINRLNDEKDNRPILNNINTQDELAEFVGKHLFERRPFYHLAKKSVHVKLESPAEISENIIENLL